VQEGALAFSSMEGCCDPGAYCWGNNPSTPYGTYALPPAPGLPPRDDAMFDDFGPIERGLSRDFLLRPDEAIVWQGTMPPTARYFGLRTYLGQRPPTDVPIIGSLGPSLNQLVVADARAGEGVWGEPVAEITTADFDEPCIEVPWDCPGARPWSCSRSPRGPTSSPPRRRTTAGGDAVRPGVPRGPGAGHAHGHGVDGVDGGHRAVSAGRGGQLGGGALTLSTRPNNVWMSAGRNIFVAWPCARSAPTSAPLSTRSTSTSCSDSVVPSANTLRSI